MSDYHQNETDDAAAAAATSSAIAQGYQHQEPSSTNPSVATTSYNQQQQQRQSNRARNNPINNNNNNNNNNNPFRYNPIMQENPFVPTANNSSNYTSLHQQNATTEWFRHAPVTKVILLGTIICYFVLFQLQHQNQQQHYNNHYMRNDDPFTLYRIPPIITRTTSSSSSVMNVSWYQYVTSKIVFGNNRTCVMIGTILQFHLYRIFERQMSSKQFLYFLIFLYFITICLEIFFYFPICTSRHKFFRQQQQQPAIETMITTVSPFGPYHMIGALSLYYDWYIPQVYPRLVSIFYNTIHFSEKSLFHLFVFYFIWISNASTVPAATTSGSLFTRYNGSINAIIYMSMGMIGTILYHYISNHPFIIRYESIFIHHPFVQRLLSLITTRTTTATTPSRSSPYQNASRRTTQQQQPSQASTTNRMTASSSSSIRQRHNATGTAATVATPSNAWRVQQQGNDDTGDAEQQVLLQQQLLHQLQQQLSQSSAAMMSDTNDGTNTTMNTTNTTSIPLMNIQDVDPDAIEQLCHMGFERPQVILALRQSHNNVEHAANRLLGGG